MIGQDDAPEGHASAITLPEDVQASGSIVMSDPDIGDTLQATLGTGPLNGSAAVNLDGTFTYMPNANFSGTDSFTIVVTDTSGLTDIVTVNLMVTPFNDAPSGTAPTVTTPEETAINGTVTMTDPDIGDVVQATLGTTPSYGTASVNLDGTYTYTPDTDFAGDDSFTVIVTDNAGLSDTVIVNVTVSPVDDAPVGTAPAIATPEDQQVSGTISMVDPDTGDTPEASLATGPANGTAIVNPDGTFTYTPTTNFAGLDSFTVDITDDTGLTDTVTVNVTVAAVDDDAPVGTAAPIVTNEDNAVGGAVTMTDPDAGDTPSASLGAGPTHGTAVINADGSFTYTPNADYAGSDSFTVVITDDTGLTDSVEVDVTVVAVNNDAPMGTVPVIQTTEQTVVNGSVVMTDPDFGDSPEASLGTGPTNGFATVNPDGTFSYTPTTNYVGTDSFTIVVTDDTGLTDTVTVNVTIDAAESLPRVAETIEPTEPEATPAPDTPVTPSEPVTTELEPIVEEIPVTTSGPQLPEAPPPPQPASVAVAPVIPTAPQPNVTAPVDEPEPEPAPAPEPVQDFEPIAAENLISIKEPATLVHETTQRAATNYELKPIEKSVFSNDLKRSTDDVRNYKEFFGTAAANVTFAFSSILSVGGASFVLRSGVVAAALMSAVPAWGRFDPISIVTGRKDDCDDNEPSDAEMMLEFVQDARNRVVTTGSE